MHSIYRCGPALLQHICCTPSPASPCRLVHHPSRILARASPPSTSTTTLAAPTSLCPPPRCISSDVRHTLQQLESTIGPLSDEPQVPPPSPIVVVISGPSGVGKDAVIKQLQDVRPDLYFVVTATSRGIRPGEVDGKDYFFVTKEKFEQWIEAGALLEHALVYGEYKGIPREQVDAALRLGTDVILRIDVQGAETVRRLMPSAVTIFICAESEAVLVERLVARKTEPLDKMAVRVATARQETLRTPEFDYVVVNREGRLQECVDQIAGIIDAEKLRTSRRLAYQQQQQERERQQQ